MHAVPKARKLKKEEPEPVEAKSYQVLATEALGALLSDSAKARTLSIKLANVQYAKELSKQLLDHASKLEETYKRLQKLLEKPDDKTLRMMLEEIGTLTQFGEKAQAGYYTFILFFEVNPGKPSPKAFEFESCKTSHFEIQRGPF